MVIDDKFTISLVIQKKLTFTSNNAKWITLLPESWGLENMKRHNEDILET